MYVNPHPESGPPVQPASRSGFTLIELILVIQVLGLLFLIAYGNVHRFSERTQMAACVANQRKIHEAGILYGIEQDPGTMVVNSDQFWLRELVQKKATECPASTDDDYDDYDVMFVASEVSLITCETRGGLHSYTP